MRPDPILSTRIESKVAWMCPCCLAFNTVHQLKKNGQRCHRCNEKTGDMSTWMLVILREQQ